MAIANKYLLGFLLVLITLTSVYVAFQNDVKLRVDNDKSTFYVLNENNRWIVSGREYNSLFDGTSKMNRRILGIERDVIIDNISNTVTITRKIPYIRGPIIKDTYFFDGNLNDVELFPIYHMIEIINGSGYFFRYEIRDLNYDGDTYKLTGETNLSFGLKMRVELHPNYRWAWIYKDGIVKAQYDILTDYEVFDVRLFDPPSGEIRIDDTLYDTTDEKSMSPPGVFINISTGYVVYADLTGNGDLVFSKTGDEGTTWDAAVQISNTGAFFGSSIWWDQWSPDDTSGNLIHIIASEVSSDDTWYFTINTDTDAIGGDVAVLTDSSISASDGGTSITKSSTGMLYAAGQLAGTVGIANSTDGVTWQAMTPGWLFNDDDDTVQLLPIADGDILVIYLDQTANEIRSGIWDESAQSWVNTNVLVFTGTDFAAAFPHGGGTVDRSTDTVYFSISPDSNTASDRKVFKFDSGRTWEDLGVVASSTMYQSGMVFDETLGELYLVYATGTTTVNQIWWKVSGDGGATWSAATQINTIEDDIKFTKTNLMSDVAAFAFWYNDDLQDFYSGLIEELPPTYTLDITAPTTETAMEVVDNEAVTINYTIDRSGVPFTSGVDAFNLTIGDGYECNLTVNNTVDVELEADSDGTYDAGNPASNAWDESWSSKASTSTGGNIYINHTRLASEAIIQYMWCSLIGELTVHCYNSGEAWESLVVETDLDCSGRAQTFVKVASDCLTEPKLQMRYELDKTGPYWPQFYEDLVIWPVETTWYDNNEWHTNCTTPIGLAGLYDLNTTAISGSKKFTEIEVDAIDYGGVGDTCDCPGDGNDWEIDHSDACVISIECLLGIGKLSFIDLGETRCDAHITTTDLGDPGSGGVLSILDDCWIEVS